MRECLKQTTVAVIMKDKKLLGIGINLINNENITECPRKNSNTGEDYDKCRNICGQIGHAEEMACEIAGKENCKDATLYLIGHTYACIHCKLKMREYGIKQLILCETGEVIKL